MKAYYGFKVKGNTAEFLEQFKDFQWIAGVQNTGFLGVEINSTEYVERTINFPKLLENYLTINSLSKVENKKLLNELLSYQKQEKEPIIFQPLEYSNKFFDSWKEFQSYQDTKIKKNKP